jgi:hypothetical protein
MALPQIEDGRTMDPQIPNFRTPAAAAEQFVISLEPYWTHTSRIAKS